MPLAELLQITVSKGECENNAYPCDDSVSGFPSLVSDLQYSPFSQLMLQQVQFE